MKHRFELVKVYYNFAKLIETQFSKRIKFFNLIMLLSTLNMLSKLFCIPMTLFIN